MSNSEQGTNDKHLKVVGAGSIAERLIFSNRAVILALFALITAFLGFNASHIKPDASFERLIPLEHPFIVNMLDNRNDLENLGNAIRVAVAVKEGDVFNKSYMETLSKITDELFYLPGVDRSGMKSLWTPNVRWVEVTEDGFQGGPVIPDGYDGSEASLNELRQNILKSGQVGSLVADDFKSTIVYIPLFETNPETNEPLDYKDFSLQLEEKVRNEYQSQNPNINIHIIGFAKKIGDLIEGIASIAMFALVTICLTLTFLFAYSRCFIGTLVPVFTSIVAVIWQLGILHLLGYGLDPYSVLVPFLVFAIGISHGVQIISGIAIESGKGANKLMASRLAFRSLYVPGMLALLSDGLGFLTLLFIEIGVIQELAIAASVGVAMIIVTNLVLVPLVMSYVGISQSGIRHAEDNEKAEPKLWKALSKVASKKVAPFPIIIAIAMAGFGIYKSQDLQIGDLDAGAPELHPNSRYNLDNAYMVENYSTSSDVFLVMVETSKEQCNSYKVMDAIDRFMWYMESIPGVQSTVSMVTVSKLVTKGMNEGSIKWSALSRNQTILNTSIQRAPAGLLNQDCSMAPVVVYLNDHKAETLERAVAAVESFKAQYDDQIEAKYFAMSRVELEAAIAAGDIKNAPLRFQLASGNAGIEAATNEVIGNAQNTMLIFVYVVVFVLCFATFRSIRAIACILIPLALTSILCQALMAYMGIGVKVATLPVIALGVGIGVDYGIYIYNRLEVMLIAGKSLQSAFFETLKSTGKAVMFTGVTLAIGVGTWIFSPIKFQADMGILLTFMFIWNMLGALILLPALATFILKPEQIIARHKKIHGDVDPAGL